MNLLNVQVQTEEAALAACHHPPPTTHIATQEIKINMKSISPLNRIRYTRHTKIPDKL